MATEKLVRPRSKVVEGLKVPFAFHEESVRSALAYKPRPDDMFLMTFPKCGTTWMQHILYLLLHKGQPPEDFMHIMQSSPFLEITGAEAAEKMPRPGIIRMHTPFHLTPYSPTAKYLVVVRNPKDTCVSFYYHIKKQHGSNFEKASFDDFFELFVRGENDYGDYFDNVLSWYEHRDDPNVLLVTYEEMKADLRPVIKRVAEFLGPQWSEMLRDEPGIVDDILRHSTIDVMKERVNKGIGRLFSDEKYMEAMSANEAIAPGMRHIIRQTLQDLREGKEIPKMELVRKGIIGDWRNHFSEEQMERMNARIAEKTKGTELMDLWKGLDV